MKNFISLIFISMLLSSCSDFLDRGPNDSLFPEIFWETENDAKLALTACYRGFESANHVLYRDCASDNAYNFHRHEGWQSIGDGTTVPGDPGTNMFSYVTIRKCNEFLENVDKINYLDTPNGLTGEQKKKAHIGEVRFIRAYRYFILSQFYGDVPLVIKTFLKPEDAAVTRDSRATVEDFIIAELKEISNGYLLVAHEAADKGRVINSAAHALLSRIYLYKKMYRESIDEAKLVTGHTLFPTYEGVFLLQNNGNQETILEYQHLKTLLKFDFTPFLPNSGGGWSSVVPLQSLVDSYEMADGLTVNEAKDKGVYDETDPYINRDPRLRETIIYPGQLWNGKIYKSVIAEDLDHPRKANNASKSGYNFKKYFSNLSQYNGEYYDTGKNITLIRYAEVLLNLAEAKIELNQIDSEMYDAIDLVRNRAEMPSVDRTKYNTQAKLIELIRRERRSEFAFEGLRRFDIIRWDIAKTVMNGPAYGAREGKVLTDMPLSNGDVHVNLTGSPFNVDARKFEDRNMLLPIPQTSIDKNKNLLPNNPGYN